MDYKLMTDLELVEIRKGLPKYLNDCTAEQATIAREAWQEQKRRYDATRKQENAEYNQAVEKAGFKVGDRVSYFSHNMLGIGGMLITGTVGKRKKYFISLDKHCQYQGKTAHLTSAWRKECIP